MCERSGDKTVTTKYKRVVVKVSGESLGLMDPATFRDAMKPLCEVHALGVQMGVVVGGGNLLRGDQAHLWGIERQELDVAGMLATGINAALMVGTLISMGVPARMYSRGPCSAAGAPYDTMELRQAVSNNEVCVIAGGLGVPGISTDVAATALAADLSADAVIMSKFGVDGVYDADPRRNASARRLPDVDASFALAQNLQIMDREALALAIRHAIKIRVIPADSASALRESITSDVGPGSTIWPR